MQVPLIPPPPAKPANNNMQRYFRVAFTRPSVGSGVGQHSAWYAHFDGQWIARQMEIHPDREPLLLIAGKGLIVDIRSLNYLLLNRWSVLGNP